MHTNNIQSPKDIEHLYSGLSSIDV